jgi:hypothetical protein
MKKAIILCTLDKFANAVKPNKLKNFLEKNGFCVELFSSSSISRLGNGRIKSLVPGNTILQWRLYFLEILQFIASKQKNTLVKKIITSFIIQKIIKLRGEILGNIIRLKKCELLICENNLDEAVVNRRVSDMQILDLPSPYAEEIFYGNELSQKSYLKLKNFEVGLYKKADYLSFHWYKYSEYVKNNKYNGANFINIGYGTTLKEKKARYNKKPKVVFLGFLGGYWTNLPLLEKLSKIYPIDVYGGPHIPNLQINYKGYAPSLDILSNYQFGLITISDDPLRRNSFSSKQLEYFSYGLPVLTPEWKKDELLKGGSIYYNIDNFASLIKTYTIKEKWEEKSDAAVNIAKELNWENVFNPLKEILNNKK